MKKILYILLLILLSCDNELEINSDWQDIPVIYSVLDSGAEFDGDGSNHSIFPLTGIVCPQSNDFNIDGDSENDLNTDHFVRIQKSFLGSESALNYTNIYDSIYYNTNDLEVWATYIDCSTGEESNSYPLNIIYRDDLNINNNLYKDDGLFNSDNYYLYKLPDVISGLVPNQNCNTDYKLFVLNKLTGDTASAITNIVKPLKLYQSGFSVYNEVFEFSTLQYEKLTLRQSDNAEKYFFTLTFHYIEQTQGGYNSDLLNGNDIPTDSVFYKSFSWNIPVETVNYGTTIDFQISSAEFFEKINTQIIINETNNNVYRYPRYSYDGGGVPIHRCIDLKIVAVNAELDTYINTSQPNYGLNQETPEYNNIVNGIGHFSSRSTMVLPNFKMDNLTMNKIASDFPSLNFSCFEISANNVYVNFGLDCVE